MESRVALFENEAKNLIIPVEEVKKGKDVMESFDYCTEAMINTYQQLLSFTIVSTKKEQNLLSHLEQLEAARDQALKLTMAFGTFDQAITYLREAEKRGNEITHRNRFALFPDAHMKTLIHDACLFSLPDSKWNVPLWQTIISSHSPNSANDSILRLLPFAGKIEAYVSQKENLEKIIREEIKVEYIQKFSEEFDLLVDQKNEGWISSELKKERKLIKKMIDDQLDLYLREELNLPTSEKLSQENWGNLKTRKNNLLPSDLQKKLIIETEVIQELKDKLKNESKNEYVQRKLNSIKTHLHAIARTRLESDLLSSKTSISRLKQYAKMVFYSKSSENLEAAEKFFEWGMSESAFNLFITLNPQDSEEYIPQVKIKGEEIHPSYTGLILEKLDPANIEAALLGKFTSCCQYLDHPQGKFPTIHGITSKTAGFYVLRNKKGVIVSQCWAWRSRNGNMVFDSIETNIDFKKNERTVTDFYMTLADQLTKKHDIPCVLVGTGGQTPSMGIAEPVATEHPIDYNGYRDSKYQQIIAIKNLPLLPIYKDQHTDSKLTSARSPDKILLDKRTTEILYDLYSKNEKLKDRFKPDEFTFSLSESEINLRVESTKIWKNKIKNIDVFFDDLKPLLKSINPNTKDEDGNSALHYAAKSNRWDIVVDLIDASSEINIRNRDGLTILHYAVNANQLETVKLLIKNGVNVNIADNFGKTAFHRAIKNRNFELIKFLVENGADVNAKYSTEYVADINIFSDLIADDQLDIYFYLINHGADVNIADERGSSPIHYAAKTGKLHLVKKLLECGANINAKNIVGETALHYAVEIGSLERVQYFVEKNIDLKAKKQEYEVGYITALNISMNLGNTEIFKYLIDHGAMTNEIDKSIFYKALIKKFIKKNPIKNIFNPIDMQIQQILLRDATDEEKTNAMIALAESLSENIASGKVHLPASDKIKFLGTNNFLSNISNLHKFLLLISEKKEEKPIQKEQGKFNPNEESENQVLNQEMNEKPSEKKDDFEKLKVSEKSIFKVDMPTSSVTKDTSPILKNKTDDPNRENKMN